MNRFASSPLSLFFIHARGRARATGSVPASHGPRSIPRARLPPPPPPTPAASYHQVFVNASNSQRERDSGAWLALEKEKEKK